jgi:hypothetical protein
VLLSQTVEHREFAFELTDFNRKANQTGLDDCGTQRHIDRSGGTTMRKSLAICSLLLLAPLAFGEQHGHAATKGSAHSNAPAKAHSASSDRDKGKARAADVGKGKKKGLKRFFSKHNHGKK